MGGCGGSQVRIAESSLDCRALSPAGMPATAINILRTMLQCQRLISVIWGLLHSRNRPPGFIAALNGTLIQMANYLLRCTELQ